MSLNKKQYFYALTVFITLFFLYPKRYAIADILSVFAYAVFFLLLLSPLCSVFEKKGIPSSISSFLSLICGVIAILMLFSIFLPYLIHHTGILLKQIIPIAQDLTEQIALLLDRSVFQKPQNQGYQQLISKLIPGVSSFAARESMEAAAYAGRVFFALILTYYLLRDRSIWGRYLLLCFPLQTRIPILQAALGCKNALFCYLSGIMKTSLFITCMMYVGLLFLEIENALLLSLFMGIFEVIPYLGPIIGSVPIVLSSLPYGIKTTCLSLALVFIVQQIENSFAGPYFTASSTAVHPLFALISVFILGSLFGIWGIILAIPIIVTLRSFFWSLRRYQHHYP